MPSRKPVIKIVINAEGLPWEDLQVMLDDAVIQLQRGKKSIAIHGPGGYRGSCVVSEE